MLLRSRAADCLGLAHCDRWQATAGTWTTSAPANGRWHKQLSWSCGAVRNWSSKRRLRPCVCHASPPPKSFDFRAKRVLCDARSLRPFCSGAGGAAQQCRLKWRRVGCQLGVTQRSVAGGEVPGAGHRPRRHGADSAKSARGTPVCGQRLLLLRAWACASVVEYNQSDCRCSANCGAWVRMLLCRGTSTSMSPAQQRPAVYRSSTIAVSTAR